MTINEALTKEEDGFFIDYPDPFGVAPEGYEFVGGVRPVREIRPKRVSITKVSSYARIFGKKSVNWTNTSELNRMFLQCQESYANNLLRSRGHVFLNEVYDLLGLDRSPEGQIVGWYIDESNSHEDITFGIHNLENLSFVNGDSKFCILDFNVDGVIYDRI